MTTAHRPTFDPARGKEAQRGPAFHQRLLPAHTQLKFRKPGQGGVADASAARDLRAELLAAEAAHFAKTGRVVSGGVKEGSAVGTIEEAREAGTKRAVEAPENGGGEEDLEAKRRKILEETRDIDADSETDPEESDDSDSDSDSEDETAELQRELEKIKRERAEKREAEERERLAREEEDKGKDIAMGNPLLAPKDFQVRRRWDDDVVFKNQARGTEERGKKKEFVNDLLRSDFHKRFMGKYVR
jgi:protein CWC15